MRFFNKLFGSVSDSDEKNNYARATLKFATSPEIKNSNAIVYNKQGLASKAKGEYSRTVSGYTESLEISKKNAVAVMDIGFEGLEQRRISITFYKSYKSKTYVSISPC